MTFSSQEELYKRIKPALDAKLSEINKLGFINIKQEDIWNYLKNNIWIKSTNLLLYQMVNDIFNFNDYDLI